MANTITGGCLCGAVRYECSAAPIMQANCYCRDCQKSSGGAGANALLVPKDAFKVTKGELKYYESTADSGNKIRRGFCANCGSGINAMLSGAPMVTVKAGSLDDPSLFQPTAAIFVSSAPKWAHVPDNIPKFDKMPG
jgi:hypothetical protein